MATPTANQASPPAASAAPAQSAAQNAAGVNTNIVLALANALRSKASDPEAFNQVLSNNLGTMQQLMKSGLLNQVQLAPLKQFLEQHAALIQAQANAPTNTSASTSTQAQTQTQAQSQSQTQPATAATASQPQSTGFKSSMDAATPAPVLTSQPNPGEVTAYPISQTLSVTNPGPVPWASAQQGRPTLTAGIPSGRISGTPAQIARAPDDPSLLGLDDNRTRRKSTPGDQSMRRSIQDLVASVDPNVKIEPEVEDLLLAIADEFIDSVTNFGCRLAKHRGGDTLEVRDLQLHLERNHNIRIPGFASDETRISLSQSSVAPAVPATSAKKAAQGTSMTLRSHRIAQVQQAKRDAKLS